MKIRFVAARAVTGAFLALTPITWVSAATPGKVTSPTPAELVTAALKTELDGPSEQREALLREALDRDPGFAPARWHLGYVRRKGKWRAVDEIASPAAEDKRFGEYRRRRDSMIDTADQHRALATWCRRARLKDEERIHWAKVLEFNRQDAEALAALGLEFYGGQLLTRQQIIETKRQASEQLRAKRRWEPQMVKWRATLDEGTQDERAAAIDALKDLSAPEAIIAMRVTPEIRSAPGKADEATLILLEKVGRTPGSEATGILRQLAVSSSSKRVREAAIDQLASRPLYAYVPQLIATIPRPIDVKSQYEIYLLPNGAVVLDHLTAIEGASGTRYIAHRVGRGPNPNETPERRREDLNRSAQLRPSRVAGLERAAERLDEDAAATRRQHAMFRNLFTSRVRTVLARVAPFDLDADPDVWPQQWNAYLETYRPPANPYYSSPDIQTEYHFQWKVSTCFPAGTTVQTTAGATLIEKINVGDRVLSQDPATGELAYKTVQGLTLRPPAPLVKIGAGSTSVAATRGHPFWVNGEGWTMAKHLKVGDVLHGLDGAAVIDSIQEAPAKEAYNLVVTDYGTYFVGEMRVLVHDNMPLVETTALVPGLSVHAVSR